MSSNQQTNSAGNNEDMEFLAITENLRRAMRERASQLTVRPNEEFERRLSEMVSHGTIPPTRALPLTDQGEVQRLIQGEVQRLIQEEVQRLIQEEVQRSIQGEVQRSIQEEVQRSIQEEVQRSIQGQLDNCTSRMMARGLFPAPLQPPRNMFGIQTRQLALPTVQGQAPGPQEAQGRVQAQPQGQAPSSPEEEDDEEDGRIRPF
ncbi:hypothetical protein X797_007090 [Metarhizium robertsii]|uniref:Uncharacterized protein n=1 Tax=Metarhizium robertsii TaxID=568076 RepID=A0A014QYW0_9HYPO|nr:hypothetical protein X797_007090 [Metarhizium robertsii]